jgi:hypothetical protein
MNVHSIIQNNQKEKQLKSPLTDEWTNIVWDIRICYLARYYYAKIAYRMERFTLAHGFGGPCCFGPEMT